MFNIENNNKNTKFAEYKELSIKVGKFGDVQSELKKGWEILQTVKEEGNEELYKKFEKEYKDLYDVIKISYESEKSFSKEERKKIILELGDMTKLAGENGLDKKNLLKEDKEENAFLNIDENQFKYLNEIDKENVLKIQIQTQKIIQKFPQYKNTTNNFINNELKVMDLDIKNFNDQKSIGEYFKKRYELLLKKILYLNEIYNLEILKDEKNKDGFVVKYLFKITKENLQNLNKLFLEAKKDPKKQKELNDFIEKGKYNDLLYLPSIKELFTNTKKEEYGIKDGYQEQLFDAIVIDLSKIKDKSTKDEIVKMLKKFDLKNKKDEIKNIFEDYINNLKNKKDLQDDVFYEISILEDIGAKILDLSLITYDDKETIYIFDEIDQLKESGKTELIKKIEESIKNKLNNDPKILYELEQLKNTNTEDIKDIKAYLKLYEDINNTNLGVNLDEVEVVEEIGEQKKEEIEKNQDKLNKLGLGLKYNKNGQLVGQNGEKNFEVKLGNQVLKSGDDGKIFIQGAMGYSFKYDNNKKGIDNYLSIAEKIEYVDKMGFGYFGDNFKKMIDIINDYTPLTGLKYINVNDKEINSTNFINQIELDEISKVFNKMGFLKSSNHSYGFKNGIMEKIEFDYIIQENFKGNNFLKGGEFNYDLFRNIIKKINWSK